MSNSKCLRSSEIMGDDSNLDYINKLPDEILVYILDKLALEEALVTSFLSKRWKGLWRYKKNIDLGFWVVLKTHKAFLPSALKFFRALNGQNMQRIHVSFEYDYSMSTDLQSLIAYTSLKKVEELYIDFDVFLSYRANYPLVSIPECELRHSSVVKLTLMSLQLETLPPRSFKALRELFFERVKLADDSVQNITGNCPSLAFLSLSNCNPNTNLRVIVAENSSLVHLVIKEFPREVSRRTTLSIEARVLKTIEFAIALPRKVYQIEATLVCSEAAFRLNEMHYRRQAMKATSVGIQGNFVKNFWGLFNRLKAANVLTLSSWCIQVLAVEVARMKSPLNTEVQHLTLETGLSIWEFRGIAYLLLGSSKLEHLVISMGAHNKIDFTNIRCKRLNANPVSYGKILQNLAIVEFRNYEGSSQIVEECMFREDLFFQKYDCGSLLVWNLKIFASNLQKMRFITAEKRFETRECGNLGELGNPDSAGRSDYCRFFDLYHSIFYLYSMKQQVNRSWCQSCASIAAHLQ